MYIDDELYNKLTYLGIIPSEERSYNIGKSDYSEKVIQPWSVWMDWKLNPWDADIIKRISRKKEGESRVMDYQKIIHICQERIRQIDNEKLIKDKQQ